LSEEQIARMETALDLAWGQMVKKDASISGGLLAATARELLARNIVDEARKGIADSAELAQRAIVRIRL